MKIYNTNAFSKDDIYIYRQAKIITMGAVFQDKFCDFRYATRRSRSWPPAAVYSLIASCRSPVDTIGLAIRRSTALLLRPMLDIFAILRVQCNTVAVLRQNGYMQFTCSHAIYV